MQIHTHVHQQGHNYADDLQVTFLMEHVTLAGSRGTAREEVSDLETKQLVKVLY